MSFDSDTSFLHNCCCLFATLFHYGFPDCSLILSFLILEMECSSANKTEGMPDTLLNQHAYIGT